MLFHQFKENCDVMREIQFKYFQVHIDNEIKVSANIPHKSIHKIMKGKIICFKIFIRNGKSTIQDSSFFFGYF